MLVAQHTVYFPDAFLTQMREAMPSTLSFDDFLAGIDAFGERIQPLMRCRNHIASVTREVA